MHLEDLGRDLLPVIAVTQGWNGYRNKSQNRKLTLEKKILQGLKPAVLYLSVYYLLQKVDPEEENSPAAPAGTQTRDLSTTSPTL